jgi:hypothetical protein
MVYSRVRKSGRRRVHLVGSWVDNCSGPAGGRGTAPPRHAHSGHLRIAVGRDAPPVAVGVL